MYGVRMTPVPFWSGPLLQPTIGGMLLGNGGPSRSCSATRATSAATACSKGDAAAAASDSGRCADASTPDVLRVPGQRRPGGASSTAGWPGCHAKRGLWLSASATHSAVQRHSGTAILQSAAHGGPAPPLQDAQPRLPDSTPWPAPPPSSSLAAAAAAAFAATRASHCRSTNLALSKYACILSRCSWVLLAFFFRFFCWPGTWL